MTGYGAFDNCAGLTSVEFPESVEILGDCVLSSCDNLTSVIIHKNVKNIGYNVFDYCPKLTELVFKGTEAEWLAIEKDSDWKDGSSLKAIICTDTTIKP